MRRLLQVLLDVLRILTGRAAVRASLEAGQPYNLTTRRENRMDVTRRIDGGQAFDLFFKPENRHGNPAAVDGVPQWDIVADADSNDVATIAPAADGLSARVTPNAGATGRFAALVTVTGDADLGEGVRPVVAVAHVEVFVIPEEATGAALVAGDVFETSPE